MNIDSGNLVDFKIVRNAGHYDIYIDGDFYCSADTYNEAVKEVEQRCHLM